ncbi:hypothetical protein B0H21DRAFT_251320 [Amylocystis lapponica]|nr:hypothetical protein B0H21DRAFT_251320 [Amylocystis lapponica]
MKFHIPSFRRNKPDSTPKDLNHTEETFIAHVPDDVLYRIFCRVIVDAYQSYPSHMLKRTRKRHGGDSMPTITISHVCSYWRKLALESPILWTLIEVNPYSHPAMLDAFLIRSRTAPLVIRFHDPAASLRARPPQTDHLLDHAQTLSSHADRFVGFDLKLSTGNAERVLSCFKSPCTHLQQLLLFSPHGVLHQYPFAATLPSLRVVRIKGLRVPWLRYTSLTKLILSGQFALPFKDLLWTLQHCPELEVLSLILLSPQAENRIAAKEGVTLPPSNVPFSDVTSRIELPRLRNLSTNWAGAQPDMFFVGRRVTPFLFILCSRFWSMVVAQLDMARLDMESYNGYNRVSLCFHSKDGVSTMRWNFDAGHIEMALAVLEGVDLAILSLPSLRSLSIFAGGSMPLLKRHWLFLLRGIEPTVVVDVSVDGSDAGASALLSALRQGYEADSDAQAGDVLCPH